MTGPISPHYILSTLPIGIIIRYPGKFVLHFWACISPDPSGSYVERMQLTMEGKSRQKSHF